jgi:hypothetical protein
MRVFQPNSYLVTRRQCVRHGRPVRRSKLSWCLIDQAQRMAPMSAAIMTTGTGPIVNVSQ